VVGERLILLNRVSNRNLSNFNIAIGFFVVLMYYVSIVLMGLADHHLILVGISLGPPFHGLRSYMGQRVLRIEYVDPYD
jgi:polysaccharide pyruvyl transferase WcaK-like protein